MFLYHFPHSQSGRERNIQSYIRKKKKLNAKIKNRKQNIKIYVKENNKEKIKSKEIQAERCSGRHIIEKKKRKRRREEATGKKERMRIK